MKHLILVRHAKSSWKSTDLQDYDRPLNARGIRDLPALCERLKSFNIQPDQLIYSPAIRTQLTADRIMNHLKIQTVACSAVPDIYEANVATLLTILQRTTEETTALMLVGHNPGLQELGSVLTAETVPHFPTSAVLHLELDIARWTDLRTGCARCIRLDYPKLHQH